MVETSHLLYFLLFSTAPTLMYFYHISCEFKKKLETNAVNFVRNAVKNGEKNSSCFSYIFLQRMRWIAVKYLFSRHSRYYFKKITSCQVVRTSHLLDFQLFSTAPTLIYLYHISCEFKKKLETNAVNFVRNAVNGGWRKFSSRISYIFLQRMRWIAVNFFVFTNSRDY